MVCGDHGQKNTLIVTAKALMTSNLANGEVLVVGLQQVVHSFIVQLAEAASTLSTRQTCIQKQK